MLLGDLRLDAFIFSLFLFNSFFLVITSIEIPLFKSWKEDKTVRIYLSYL